MSIPKETPSLDYHTPQHIWSICGFLYWLILQHFILIHSLLPVFRGEGALEYFLFLSIFMHSFIQNDAIFMLLYQHTCFWLFSASSIFLPIFLFLFIMSCHFSFQLNGYIQICVCFCCWLWFIAWMTMLLTFCCRHFS